MFEISRLDVSVSRLNVIEEEKFHARWRKSIFLNNNKITLYDCCLSRNIPINYES